VSTSDDYAFVEAAGGGLLLEFNSGALMELNESAAFVWRQKLANRPEAAILSEFAVRYGLDPSTARDHVVAALELETSLAGRVESDFKYERCATGYRFAFLGQPVFEIDPAGNEVRLVTTPDRIAGKLRYLLRALAPKILALRGFTVIHASAVDLGGTLLAFSGLSGAGKTTTAKAFAAAGARLVCEDQLMLVPAGSEVLVPLGVEDDIAAWVGKSESSLGALGVANCQDLDQSGNGARVPIREIGFLHSNRRVGRDYHATRLSPASTAGGIFKNTFYGSDTREGWIRHLDVAARIAAFVHGFVLVLPAGLELLQEAAQLQAASRTLKRG